MKRALLALAAIGLFAATGCQSLNHNCNTCDGVATHGGGAGVGAGGGGGAGGHFAGGMHGGAGTNWAQAHPHHAGGADHIPYRGHHHHLQTMAGPAGPPTASVAYPYYTTRGPRDFLLANPPSIGY